MSKPMTRADHIRLWQRRKDKENRRAQSTPAPRVDPGEAWSVHEVKRLPPRLGHAAMTAARQERLRAYREATGQEPFDVPRSWPWTPPLPAQPSRPVAAVPPPPVRTVVLPPGPVPTTWTARPRSR